MSNMQELKSRIEAKKKQLEADLAKAKSDAQGKGNEAVAAIESKLHELNSSLKSGWDNLSEDVAAKLNKWLKD
jgi:hypothetical protein